MPAIHTYCVSSSLISIQTRPSKLLRYSQWMYSSRNKPQRTFSSLRQLPSFTLVSRSQRGAAFFMEQMSCQGRRSRGGWGGFSPPTFEEDDILFCFSILVYFIQANYFKKYLAENAVNTISETLDFKIFWGRMPPDPPRVNKCM